MVVLETATALVCMANALYFEARGEPLAGQIAVAHTIQNRVNDWRFPNTVCEVVTDGLRYKINNQMVKNKCAFSFYCDGKPEIIDDQETYEWMKTIAYGVIQGSLYIDLSEGATHYHANYVYPSWADTITPTVCINTHCFYRWEMD